ncbi:MAG: phospho-sugar mutase [Atribacterota bacterium]|nr:phospho-sugar mutase [Atribacterota bacterium]
MNYLEKYYQWLHSSYLSAEDKEELRSIAEDREEIIDRFYKDLEFGTGGMRGKIAIGSNRMNIYTVGQSTQGLANYLLARVKKATERGVVIAYDPRYKSREFAERSAQVLTANGIKTYLFDDIRPTPELSFAVRIIGAAAGIVITASHNPPDYNGYKVYGENGAQILPEVANQIIAEIAKIKDFSEVKLISLKEAKERGLLQLIGGALDRVYYEKVKNLSLSNDVDKELNIVYTPLHGTGNIPIRTILTDMGFKNIFVVEEQSRPDPEFSTVTSPNPENPEAFKLARQLGERVKADILVATDPDADRLAVCVLAGEQYIFLNGNQTGALLLDYILARRKERGKLPQNGFVIKTIVTSEMGRVISNSYSIPTYDTLTGFKYICNKAEELEKEGGIFLFGYEESIGYLTGNFVRDKDAVISALLVSEMAAYYKKRGLTLLAVLEELYERYGYFLEHLESIYLEGLEGEEQMQKIMSTFREEFPEIAGMPISRKIDYQTSFQYDYEHHKKESIDIPQSDVLKCIFTDGSWYAIRPSGTEPKIKIYFSLVGKDRRETEAKLEKVKSTVLRKVNVNGVNS